MVCNKCKKDQLESDFYFYKNRKMIRHPCKDCCKIRRRYMYKLYGARSANPDHSDLLKNRGKKPKGYWWCCRCKEYLLLQKFNGIKYKAPYCKDCQRYIEAVRSKNFKEKLIEFLGGKCKKCDGVFHYASYDLHHRDALTKEKSNSWGYFRRHSWTKISDVLKKEKLILFCKNCHAVAHSTF